MAYPLYLLSPPLLLTIVFLQTAFVKFLSSQILPFGLAGSPVQLLPGAVSRVAIALQRSQGTIERVTRRCDLLPLCRAFQRDVHHATRSADLHPSWRSRPNVIPSADVQQLRELRVLNAECVVLGTVVGRAYLRQFTEGRPLPTGNNLAASVSFPGVFRRTISSAPWQTISASSTASFRTDSGLPVLWCSSVTGI